jgi:site-specific DNA-methyltransferase (adenine-specific)
MENLWLMNGDSLEHMKKIPDGSVDMVLCDLPYGTTACKWDVVIPFEPLWKEYWRTLRENGAVVLFGTEPFSSRVRNSQTEHFRYDWIWEKRHFVNFAAAKKQPLKIHEIISVFSKKQATYNPQGIVKINKVTRQGRKASQLIGGSERPAQYIQEHTNYPTSVLICPKDGESHHPTQKPIPLLEYLVKTYTNEGETVLDNTMGSGSTGVACVNTDRRFIGIEKDEKYFQIAEKRIQQAIDDRAGLLFAG